ncbi:inhibitor of Bruton tyrosine kinase [Wyeomyia smithii]|uniref:inhibitor of Bruton tyrosine kinase n=1 Tax=Wyeomyia smithii TaxID=174621 RepID=UPI002467D758|nr:inhibitor of Bruton tyrosine kinase [Wyeomyia smithii]XP_055548785.1 inhibitor of Bruton tyrosine kinase [Wyeomyia smithii]
MSTTISNFDYECTKKCRLPNHGNEIIKALTKRSIADELLAAFIAKTCRNFAEILDDQGRSALHLAASVGRYAIAEWLVKHGASITAKDRESGHTALHRAMYYGCVGVAVLLLKYGASIDCPDEDFVNPLQLCSCISKEKDNGIGHELMIWGKNKNYNLGIGNVEGRDTPDFIDYFRKNRITVEKMSINAYHSVFLTKTGDVYTTGHGRGGRLGNGAENTVVFPTKVPVHTKNPDERIIDVSTGRYHTLLLSNMNVIYSCGENNHCQLGIKPPLEKQLTFKELGGLQNFAYKHILRIIAKDFHSIAISEHEVFVWGQNGGQFGMKKEVNPVIFPRPISLELELNKDKPVKATGKVMIVESSNSTIVVYTELCYLYIFNNYKRRTYKNPLMEKFKCISVSGGDFVASKEDALRQSKQLRILVFTECRNIYIWYEDSQQFVRCVFAQSRNLEIDKIIWCNNNALVLLLGHLYYGTITHKLNAQAATQISEYTETYTKKEISTTNKTRIELKRIKNLNNVVDFVCDDDGDNFAVLTENSRRYFNVPDLVESNYDFGTLLTEAHLMDGVHDLVFVVDYESFPVHRYIIYHRCRHLKKLVQKQSDSKEVHLERYDGLSAPIFELVLRYIYTNRLISQDDVEKLVKRLRPDSTLDVESVNEMLERLKKVFKQLEIGALGWSVKSLTVDPPVEEYPKLPRDSYPELRDVIIKLQDNQEIHVHKCVLMARLEYFNMMFSHSWTESKTVNLSTVPLEYMEPIVDFLYDNNYQRIREQKYSEGFLLNMIVICDQFFIEELKNVFEVMIGDRINLKNVAEFLEFGFQYNCEVLKQLCMQFISVNLAKILELRVLEGLEPQVLTHIDTFYKNFYHLQEYRMITPSPDAIGDEELVFFVDNFKVDMGVKEGETNIHKTKNPKGKVTPKSTKLQLEKRNYEKEAMGYVRDLSFDEAPVVKSNVKPTANNDSASRPSYDEAKNWQKVAEKKDPKKKSITTALKVNEIVNNETRVEENFSNLKSVLGKVPSPTETSSSPTTLDKKDDGYESGYSGSRATTFNLGDFTLQKPKLSQKQRKRLSSASEKPKEIIQQTTPENPKPVTPTNPWKSLNNSAAGMLKSAPIPITPPRDQRRATTSNGSYEPSSPFNSSVGQTIVSPPMTTSDSKSSEKEFSKIQADERRQKQYYEKIKSKSLVHTQIEERAIEELRRFYNVESVFDENITIERYRPQSDGAINFAVWQYQ